MNGGKKKQSCPFSSVPEIFPESALNAQRLPMSSSAKDVTGGKRDSGIPFSPAPCCWKNSSALRHSSATDLDVNPHRKYAEYETYFNFFTLMSVNAVISMRPGGQDMERGKGDFGRWFSSLASDALTGFPTQVRAACLCSRCLASRKPSKRTPFRGGLEDG